MVRRKDFNIYYLRKGTINRMGKVALNVPAPDFNLEDFLGNDFSLSGYSNKKNLVLVFNRGFV